MTPGELGRRLWYLVNRRRRDRELVDEMAAHRAMMADPRGFGNTLTLREQAEDVWGWGWLEATAQDVRIALRTLRRTPSFAITVVLVLAGGVGLNLTFFNLVNVTMLRPLAVTEPETLMRLERRGPGFSSSGVPYPAAQFLREHSTTLAAVLTHHGTQVVWEDGQRLEAAYVSVNWFDELGYGPAHGRLFSEAADGGFADEPVVVIGERLWRTRLGGDPAIPGRQIRLNDRLVTVAGVVPAAFPDLDLRNPQVWLPIHRIEAFEPGSGLRTQWRENNVELYARARDGLSARAAAAGLAPVLAEMARQQPAHVQPGEWLEHATAEARFLDARGRQKLVPLVALVSSLTLLVLLVACANLANLVLSRAIGRLREFSVRSALGASRWRIARQMLVESCLLAVCGAAAGIGVGWASARLVASITELPPYLDFTPDMRTYGVAFATALVGMAAFGILPAWMVGRRDLVSAMKDGGHGASAGLSRARLRLALVGVQVLGCCALLVTAGAIVRGMQRLADTSPGFSVDRQAVLDPSLHRYGMTDEAARAYWTRVAERVAAHPDVERVALATPPPIGGGSHQAHYDTDAGRLVVNVMDVGPDFFALFDVPLLAGRPFTAAEPDAVVVSRRVALQMYGTLDVLGRGYPRRDPKRTIVGVAADAGFVQPQATDRAQEYRPLDGDAWQRAVLTVRSRTGPDVLPALLMAAARGEDARVQPSVTLLRADYERLLRGPRLTSLIGTIVGALVLMLACLGIFGVTAYAARLRTKEIGIRRALGADAPRIYAVLLRQLAWPVGVGMAAGSAAGIGAGRVLAGAPFHLAAADPVAPAAALLVFLAAAGLAAIVPVSRALKSDPLHALRHE